MMLGNTTAGQRYADLVLLMLMPLLCCVCAPCCLCCTPGIVATLFGDQMLLLLSLLVQ